MNADELLATLGPLYAVATPAAPEQPWTFSVFDSNDGEEGDDTWFDWSIAVLDEEFLGGASTEDHTQDFAFIVALVNAWPDIAACLERAGNLKIDRDEANAYVEVLLERLAAAEADAADWKTIAFIYAPLHEAEQCFQTMVARRSQP